MNEVGKYHAKWNRSSPKSQRLNVFSDKCMTIFKEGGWWWKEKNEENLDGVEEKRGGREWEWKKSRMKQTVLPYICMITWKAWIYTVYNHRNEKLSHLCIINQNAVHKNKYQRLYSKTKNNSWALRRTQQSIMWM